MTDIREEILFIKRSLNWPHYPLLPMKSKSEREPGNLPVLGTMFAGHPLRVYLCTLYDMSDKAKEIKKLAGNAPRWKDVLKDLIFKDYPSVEAILEEWIID